MSAKFVILLTILPVFKCQIYFPDDYGNFQQPNITEYHNYVDQIISNGILKLTLAVQKSQPSQNIVYAPVSIAATLALVLLGSNGKTFEEIASLMGLTTGVEIQNKSHIVHKQFGRMLKKLEETSGFEIGRQVNFATGIFVQNNFPIREVYKETAETLYNSDILNVDFGDSVTAQNVVNSWVRQRTNGKIREILEEAPPSNTKVILASAMHFQAEWEKPFFEHATKKKPFYPYGKNSKTEILVEMMFVTGDFPYFKDNHLQCEIMGLPYKGGKTVMYVILPHNSNIDTLKRLKNNLHSTELERLISNVQNTRLMVGFPKMRIDSTVDLKQTLKLLGLLSLFNPYEANLALLSPGIPTKNYENNESPLIFSPSGGKRLSSTLDTLDDIRRNLIKEKYANPGLYADSVIHKVFMDITETGTEAAAVTLTTLARDGSFVNFRVDVPFLFLIRHEQTKTILFWGTVNTPTPSFK